MLLKKVFGVLILILGLASLAYITYFFIDTYSQRSDDDNPERAYQKITDFMFSQDFEQVISASGEFIKKYPKSRLIPNAHLKIADSYLEIEDYKNAIIVYKQVISEFPNSSFSNLAQKQLAIAQSRLVDPKEALMITTRQPEKDFSDIQHLFSEGEYDKAISGFEFFIRKYPQNYLAASAQFLIAESFFKKQNLKIAKDEYQKVVELYPQSEKVYLAGKQIAEIERMSGIMATSNPRSEYEKYRNYYENREYDKAIVNFRKFIRMYPTSPFAANSRYWIAESYYAKNDLQTAKKEFEIVISDYPKTDKAVDATTKLKIIEQKISDQQGSSASIDYKRIRRFYLLQEYDNAIVAFGDFLKKYPQDKLAINAQYWIGESYYAKEEFGKAIVEFQKILDNYPNQEKSVHAKLKITMSNKKLGRETASVQEQEYKAILAKYRGKRFAEAIEDFSEFIIKYPDDLLVINAMYWRGECYYSLENYQTAIEMFKQLIERFPKTEKADHARKKIDLAMVNLGLGKERTDEIEFAKIMDNYKITNYDAAIFSLKSFINLYPHSPLRAEAQFTIGEAYFKTRNFESAMWEYFKVAENYPKSSFAAEAQFKLANCAEKLSRPIQSKIEYFTLIDKYPNSEFAELAMKRVNDF